MAKHMQHFSCVADGVGQCLLFSLQMSTCALTLGGLPNGLVQHVQTLFLMKINHKSLMSPPTHEERRMYLFRMVRSNRWKNNGNSSISTCKGSWSSCQTADWRKINSIQHFSSIKNSSVAQTPSYTMVTLVLSLE